MRLSPRWLAAAALTLLALLSSARPHYLAALEWERGAMAEGQWPRLLTAHFVHLDAHHLLFNLLGLVLIVDLLMEQWTGSELATLILVSALGTSVLLWCCEPDVRWYAGLSGLLHGLWAGAALYVCLARRSAIHACALLVLGIKLVWLNNGTGATPVLPIAHEYGALSGMLWALTRRLLVIAPIRLE
jgi:rhomboid family GlyGly-CTERM serine protease